MKKLPRYKARIRRLRRKRLLKKQRAQDAIERLVYQYKFMEIPSDDIECSFCRYQDAHLAMLYGSFQLPVAALASTLGNNDVREESNDEEEQGALGEELHGEDLPLP